MLLPMVGTHTLLFAGTVDSIEDASLSSCWLITASSLGHVRLQKRLLALANRCLRTGLRFGIRVNDAHTTPL